MSLDQSVSELMEREVVSVQRSDRLDLADDIMRLGRIRHLPVLDDERVVGVLTNRDLLAAGLSKALNYDSSHRRSFMRSIEVSEVMADDVATIGPDESADDAGRRMLKRQIGCLPVVDSAGSLLGLLTETDLIRAAIEPDDTTLLEGDLAQLRRVRDELRVQVHLGKAEATDLWERLEERMQEAESRVRSIAGRAEEPVKDVTEAARLLVDEVRSGYRKIRELL